MSVSLAQYTSQKAVDEASKRGLMSAPEAPNCPPCVNVTIAP